MRQAFYVLLGSESEEEGYNQLLLSLVHTRKPAVPSVLGILIYLTRLRSTWGDTLQ